MNSAPKILITGANGQLGHDLALRCRTDGDEVTALGHIDLDIADPAAVSAMLDQVRPDIVVNCAAWTDVDGCESDPEWAQRVNADAVGFLAAAAHQVGAHLVQISTDYVFDGTLERPYREDDRPNPLSVYGTTKLAGERSAGADATIIRTSWVCGIAGNNMVKTVLRLATTHPTLSFVDDQFGNPSFTFDLAGPVRQLAVARHAGIYHVTNSTPDNAGISWYRFACDIVAAIGRDPDMVKPIPTVDLQPARPATRPANGVLDNTKTGRVRDYRAGLEELLASLITP